jgi:hypothetical protein
MLDALKALEAVAGGQLVIMINEEHRTPLHRSFTKRLLPILYKKGFRYLALESLSETDTKLNSRKYPVQKSDTYSGESGAEVVCLTQGGKDHGGLTIKDKNSNWRMFLGRLGYEERGIKLFLNDFKGIRKIKLQL